LRDAYDRVHPAHKRRGLSVGGASGAVYLAETDNVVRTPALRALSTLAVSLADTLTVIVSSVTIRQWPPFRGVASGSSACQADQVPDNGVVSVTAVAPGVAQWGSIDHHGSASNPSGRNLRAGDARVLFGQSVVVTALLTGFDQTPLFAWYRGRIGDYSRPIRLSSDPHLTFISSALGVA